MVLKLEIEDVIVFFYKSNRKESQKDGSEYVCILS